MKKKFLSVVLIIVVALVLALTGVLAGCDKEKQEASIEANRKQSFVYDGNPHRLVAQLSHSECDLEYYYKNNKLDEPVFTEVGSYVVTVKAPETEHYKAPEEQRVTVVISQDLDGLLSDVMSIVDTSSDELLSYEIDTSLEFKEGASVKNFSLVGKGYINLVSGQAKAFLEAKKGNVLSFGLYLDGNDVYLDLGAKRYKYEDLFKLPENSEIATAGEGVDILALIKIALNATLDNNAIKSLGNGSYIVHFSTSAMWGKISRLVSSFLGGELDKFFNYSNGDPAFIVNGKVIDFDYIDALIKNNDATFDMEINTAGGVLSGNIKGQISTSEEFGNKNYDLTLGVQKLCVTSNTVDVVLPIENIKNTFVTINPINAEAEGTITFSDGKGASKQYYCSLKANFNPSAIIFADRDNILDSLKKSGYLYIDASSVVADERCMYAQLVYDPVHSNDGNVYLFLKSDNNQPPTIATFDIVDVIDIIDALMKGEIISLDSAAGPALQTEDDIKLDYALRAISGLVKSIENVIKNPEQGFTIDAETVKAALEAINAYIAGADIDADKIVEEIYGNYNAINIALHSLEYGAAQNDFNAYSLAQDKKYYDNASDSLNGIFKNIEYIKDMSAINPDEIIALDADNPLASLNAVTQPLFKATYIDGSEKQLSNLFVYAVKGLDLTNSEVQTVTVYVQAGEGSAISTAPDISFSPFGLMAVTLKVQVQL